MKAEHNLLETRSRRNPHATRLRRQVAVRVGTDVIACFKDMAEQTGIPYEDLIGLYLRDCVQHERKLALKWA
jgi:hypothetical protein